MQSEIELFMPTIEYSKMISKNIKENKLFIVSNKNTMMGMSLPDDSYIYCVDTQRIYLNIEMLPLDNIEEGLKCGKCIPWYFHLIH